MNVSQILFERLHAKPEERDSIASDRKIAAIAASQKQLQEDSKGRLSYAEWLKSKDAEKRLKRKLINQA